MANPTEASIRAEKVLFKTRYNMDLTDEEARDSRTRRIEVTTPFLVVGLIMIGFSAFFIIPMAMPFWFYGDSISGLIVLSPSFILLGPVMAVAGVIVLIVGAAQNGSVTKLYARKFEGARGISF